MAETESPNSRSLLFIDDDYAPFDESGSFLGGYVRYYDRALREAGFSVTGATTYDDAQSAISSGEKYDVILSDLFLGDEEDAEAERQEGWRPSGFRLVQQICESRPDAVVFVFSNLKVPKEWSLPNNVTSLHKVMTRPGELVSIIEEKLVARDTA